MQVIELRPSQVVDRWPDLAGEVLLVDVREPAEIAVARVPAAVHIPMGDIPTRLGELDRGRAVVVLCHHGGRSRQVAAYLQACGFPTVYNVAGGIDAWSTEVDPTIPRY